MRLLVCILLLSSIACRITDSADEEAVPVLAPIKLLTDDSKYERKTIVSNHDLQERVAQHNQFAFNLYGALAKEEGNVALSPLSVLSAFALLYPSVSEEAEKDMATALLFPREQEAFSETMKGLLIGLEDDFSAAVPKGRSVKWNLVNQVWVEKKYELQSEYLKKIKGYYNAGVRQLPIQQKPEASRNTINDFVASRTNNLIKDLLPEGVLTSDTSVVLTNSVYMLADWAEPFKKDSTRKAQFQTSSKEISVDMMWEKSKMEYSQIKGSHAVSKDYAGRKFAMMIVMPAAGDESLLEFEKTFDSSQFDTLRKGMQRKLVSLSLPKFDMKWGSNSLKEPLKKLGMKVPFQEGDRLPKLLTTSDPSWIDDVIHQCKVTVDEKGTEAAAATAVVILTKSAMPIPEETVEFKVNRPALYYVYQKSTGAVLFMGRLADPAAG